MKGSAQQPKSSIAFELPAMETLESRLLLSASVTFSHGVWSITADGARNTPGDTISIQVDGDNSALADVYVNGELLGQQLLSSIKAVKVTGSVGDDDLSVDLGDWSGKTIIRGHAGDDTITTGSSNDRLDGGSGDDTISSGGGDDRIAGKSGNDQIDGGDGDDRIRGCWGDDKINGGAGNDIIRGGRGADDMDGGQGDDRLYGGWGSDTLTGGYGADVMDGFSGHNTINSDASDTVRTRRRDVRTRAWVPNTSESNNSLRPLSSEELTSWLRAVRPAFSSSCYEWYSDLDRGFWDPSAEKFLDIFFPQWDVITPGVAASDNTIQGHSGTNTQIAGVDEGDIVETDGRYIYMIKDVPDANGYLAGYRLVIISALPADAMKVVATMDIEGTANGLYLQDGKLTILSSISRSMDYNETYTAADGTVYPYKRCRITSSLVKMSVLDLADITNPTVAEETYYPGILLDSRAVGDKVCMVIDNEGFSQSSGWFGGFYMDNGEWRTIGGESWPPLSIPDDVRGDMLKTAVDEYSGSDPGLVARQAWLDDMYQQEIQSMQPGYYKGVTIHGVQTLQWHALDENCYALAQSQGYGNVLNIVTADVGDDISGPADETSIAGANAQLCMNSNSLYLAMTNYSDVTPTADRVTQVYKFDLTNPDVPFVAGGAVAGTVVDQFSMDEYGGSFRVVTEIWRQSDIPYSRFGPSMEVDHSSLFVLQQQGDQLCTVSGLSDLGTAELQSVRFAGDHAFIVAASHIWMSSTLYAIDLTDPTAPVAKGELQMQGASTYLLPVGKDLLVGVGYELGNHNYNLKVSLYDVSDMLNPVETDSITFDAAFSSAAAETYHQSVSYYPEFGVLALPATQYGYGTAAHGVREVEYYIDAVQLVRVGQGGLSDLGSTTMDGDLERTLRIGDLLYSMSDKQIKATSVTDPADVVGTLDIADAIEEAAALAV